MDYLLPGAARTLSACARLAHRLRMEVLLERLDLRMEAAGGWVGCWLGVGLGKGEWVSRWVGGHPRVCMCFSKNRREAWLPADASCSLCSPIVPASPLAVGSHQATLQRLMDWTQVRSGGHCLVLAVRCAAAAAAAGVIMTTAACLHACAAFATSRGSTLCQQLSHTCPTALRPAAGG